MFCKQYSEAIQEFADGTLGPVRRAELQTHLEQCDECRALVADLRKIREAAAALDQPAPPDRVWLQIAGRLRQEGRVAQTASRGGRRMALLVIAAALVLMVGGSLWFLYPLRQAANNAVATGGPADPRTQGPADPRTPGSGNAAQSDTVQSIADDLMVAERHYQAAIGKLEQAAKVNDGAIDAQTAGVLRKNLQVIDQAIAESRTALNKEPQSQPARDSLFEALRRKVSLLQDTIALMNEMRKGNSAGAAQLIGDPNKS
jgi:hypothetical protein